MLPLSLLLCVAALLPSPSSAADSRTCELSLPNLSSAYDLSPLSELQTIESTSKTPPTDTIHRVRMRLCGEDGIGKEEGVEEYDQVKAIPS